MVDKTKSTYKEWSAYGYLKVRTLLFQVALTLAAAGWLLDYIQAHQVTLTGAKVVVGAAVVIGLFVGYAPVSNKKN